MSKDALKGLHSVKRRLADGSVRTHHYAWRGGPRLESEFGSPDFLTELRLLRVQEASDRRASAAPTLTGLFDAYQDSPEFRRLSERTRRDYAGILDTLRTDFGAVGLAALTVRGTRATFLDWRDEFGHDSARQADYHWTVLNIVMNWALGREKIERNPFARAGKLYDVTRADKVWSPLQERAVLAVAPPHIALAFLLALYTGQRQGDLLALTWSGYDGMRINLVQGKTNVRVSVKLISIVKDALDATPREHDHVLITARGGEPWTENGFRASWRKVKADAGIVGLTFHDLRGTAVTRLFLAGCKEAQIATITGHALKDVRSILDRHYFHRDTELGDTGIDLLEKSIKTQTKPANDVVVPACVVRRQTNGLTGLRKARRDGLCAKG